MKNFKILSRVGVREMISEIKVEEIINVLTNIILEYLDTKKNEGIDLLCNET